MSVTPRAFVQGAAGRGWFALCSLVGWMLRGSRYSSARIVDGVSGRVVHKRRSFYAPILVWLSGPLVKALDARVRVLPQREWAAREREMYERLYGAPVGVRGDGTLELSYLRGRTLAAVLEDRSVSDATRLRGVELAAAALKGLHAKGSTHADAMADNVLVDLDAGVARWFDFETVHDSEQPLAWRCADDLRALLATCFYRVAAAQQPTLVHRIAEAYGNAKVTTLMTSFFRSPLQRPLAFHLGQARLSFAEWRELGRLLRRIPG